MDAETSAIDPRDVPDAGFRASSVPQPGALYPAREATRIMGSAMWDEVLDDSPLGEVEGIPLHAYMMRRFGPPTIGGDERMVTAVWLLDTPDPEVFVEVAPRLCPGGRNFLPRILSGAEHLRVDDARGAAVAAAYRATLVDLLRPVALGENEWLNALGECDGADPACGGDGEGVNPLALEPHPSCGYATPHGACAGPLWESFWTAVAFLGKGDVAAGQEAVVSQARGKALGELAYQPEAVRLLVLAHVHGDFAGSVALFADPGEVLKDEAAAVGLALREARRGERHLPIRDLADADVRRAGELLDLFGCRTRIMDALARHRRRAAQEAFVSECLALGDFPDAALPRSALATPGEVEGLPGRLREAGLDAMAGRVERSLAEDGEDRGRVYRLLSRAYHAARAGRAAV